MSSITEESLDDKLNQLKEELRKEIPVFKEKGQKFINKEITSAEFKAASGGMGVYAQRSGEEFMIRLRVLSGVLDIETLKFVHELVDKHSLEFIHLTTRQTIQLHNLSLDSMIDIMEESIEHNIITRGGGGNYPRNVSLSPLSGVEKGEAFDVTPYAIFVNKYFVSRINTYHLPRKFKVAFSNQEQDSANATIADLGYLAIVKNGKEYFQVYLGGSMGPNGSIAVPYDELINPADILYHVEAMLNLFQEEGDYQNKGKARIRYIVQRMGREAFLECYKKHLNKVKQEQTLAFTYLNSNQHYTLESEQDKDNNQDIYLEQGIEIPGAISQKQAGLYSVDIHPQGGLLKAKDFSNILHFLEKLKSVQVRLTMEESMIVRNLNAKQAKELLELTKEIRKTTKLGCSISCIGAPICQIGVQNSRALLTNILDYFERKELKEDILPSVSISGCTNSCARHQVSEIGFQGKKKRVNAEMMDAFSLQIGGKVSKDATVMAKEYGDLLLQDIPEFLYQLAKRLQNRNMKFSQYLELNEPDLEELVSKYRVV